MPTTTLIVSGLRGEGPGDLVGAFAHEADVPADTIGRIDIDDGTASVEVDAAVADRIVTRMDGGRVGRATVTIARADQPHDEAVRRYVGRYTRLVEMERDEEMRRHEDEIRTLSGAEREAKGRAVLHLAGRKEGEGLGGYQVTFTREGEPLPDTEISIGDLVRVSEGSPLDGEYATGTVAKRTRTAMTVAFASPPPAFVSGRDLRLDLSVNDVTFQRMLDALAGLSGAEGRQARLCDVIVGTAAPDRPTPADIDTWHSDGLDEAQRDAVRRGVAAEDVHLIHGPPGTGKTTAVVELIRQCIDRGETVLATAASNTAVDNVLAALVAQGARALRLGHPARVTKALQKHTLDILIEHSETYQRAQRLRQRAFEMLDKSKGLTRPSDTTSAGLSDEAIRERAEAGRGATGVSPEEMEEMARWVDLREEAGELLDDADALRQRAVRTVIESADVVCTTNATAGGDLLTGVAFDTLVIDEATQATAPSCLIPMAHARRVIMAGDHHQLPPTVQNPEAAREGLGRTLFEALAERHAHVRTLLRVQHRMHETIMRFASEQFYDSRLEAAEAVRTHTLRDLGVTPEALPAERREVLDPDAPLVFVDTAQIDAPEQQRSGSSSRENPAEAEFVARLATDLLEAGVPASAIGVIAPYDDQARRLHDLVGAEDVEVDTVDGFQGREKEVVLVSLVRSNEAGEIGFLDDARRFNVAVTRARRKVVVVGNARTVTQADVYAAFQRYAREHGREVVWQ